jgi:DNA polymerase epsilon subunit 1
VQLGAGSRVGAQAHSVVHSGDGMMMSNASVFPRLPGSHLMMLQSPALELVKTVCHVLKLHTAIDGSCAVYAAFNLNRIVVRLSCLRRDILVGCLRVDEWSSACEWHDPCLSYVLSEVVCAHCGCCRDVDVCRDAVLLDDDGRV